MLSLCSLNRAICCPFWAKTQKHSHTNSYQHLVWFCDFDFSGPKPKPKPTQQVQTDATGRYLAPPPPTHSFKTHSEGDHCPFPIKQTHDGIRWRQNIRKWVVGTWTASATHWAHPLRVHVVSRANKFAKLIYSNYASACESVRVCVCVRKIHINVQINKYKHTGGWSSNNLPVCVI